MNNNMNNNMNNKEKYREYVKESLKDDDDSYPTCEPMEMPVELSTYVPSIENQTIIVVPKNIEKFKKLCQEQLNL